MRSDVLSLFVFSLFPNSQRSEFRLQLDRQSTQQQSRRDNFAFLMTGSSSLFISTLLSKSKATQAISSSEAETSYNKYAKTYDDLDGGSIADSLGIEEARNKLIKQAKGDVLEVAVGTGLNLSKYIFSPSATDGVTSLTLLDISDGMLAEARTKLDAIEVPSFVDVKLIKADATSSDITSMFGMDKFDTVLDTFSLCVMGNDGAKDCLKQMRNVVKCEADGGKILLIENSRSSNPLLGWYQDVTAETAAKVGGKGCVSNQNVKSFIDGIDNLSVKSEEEFASGLFRSFVCVKT
mmetsp:Transcript_19908/g.29823  ORF Transcript_19908/g.29823 Transcript_19908/m.29823 type:complete len:293 (-) Transcript_19908:2633-3511(-)